MRFIADNLALLQLGDPDFINYFVFNDFFKADIFSVALESFVDDNL
jgi:hypothetical protein